MKVRDAAARRLGAAALMIAMWAIVTSATIPSFGDSITEPDAYRVHTEMQALQDQVSQMAVQIDELEASANDQADAIDLLAARDVSPCIAYSDRHYVRETINGSKRKYRMPLVVWRLDVRECRPDSGPWKNRRIQP